MFIEYHLMLNILYALLQYYLVVLYAVYYLPAQTNISLAPW